jgi:protein KRI1
LKNAKRKELNEKLSQVKSVIGAAKEGDIDEAAIMKMLEGDFDPEEFEKAMQDAYGEDFYEKEDTEWKSDLDVRRTLQQDEDGVALVGKDDADGGMYDVYENEDDEQDNAQDYEEDEERGDEDYSEPSPEHETPLEKKLKSKVQEELYKLDYEDIVAGMPTRFKYRQVEPNDYGLTTQEILFARDNTLKQFVSLKKMAPYNEQGEFRVDSKKRRKFREQLKHDLEEDMNQNHAQESEISKDDKEAGMTEPKKKKARRLKKGKKKETQDSMSTTEPRNDSEHVAETTNSNENFLLAEKRSKKKSGKNDGILKDGGSVTASHGKGERKLHAAASPEPSPFLKLERKKKKKKSKKRKLVDGVTSSRLASYGL